MSSQWRACDNLLLIGAGFSKDFGGLLATEMWSEIFNNPGVRSFPDLLRTIEASCPDYEEVYERVVLATADSPEATALRHAVLTAYDKLDRRLRDPLDPTKNVDTGRLGEMVALFAPRNGSGRVGFVFSLNQDLFPERYAWGRLHFASPVLPPFGGLPGRAGPYLEGGDGAPLAPADIRRSPTAEEIGKAGEHWITEARFSWLKLHGSYNWRDSAGRGLMVLGGGKGAQIHQEPLLRWYWDVFQRALLDGRHRLVVVGYSFRDEHVNAAIAGAIEAVGLELVVLDMARWDQFRGLPRHDRYWGSIAQRIAYSSGSRYFQRALIDIFPYAAYGDTGDWKELRALLRSPLSKS